MLSSLKLENYRAFKHLEVSDLGRVNLFVGKNNSGKTTILEAAEMLVGKDSLESLALSAQRRDEILSIEKTQSGWGVDIRHTFHGHILKKKAAFQIQGSDNDDSLFVKCEIIPHKDIYDSRDITTTWMWTQPSLFSNGESTSQFVLSVNSNSSERPTFLPISKDGGIAYDWLSRETVRNLPEEKPLNFIRAEAFDNYKMRELWDEIALTDEEYQITETLRILEPKVERIAFLSDKPTQRFSSTGGIFVKIENIKDRIPLGSFGDGIKHLLGISLATIRSSGGSVMIDEIDTGLHHTVMGDMWRMLIETAKRLDVQVFATTHNSDCVRSLAFLHEQFPELCREVRLHRVERERERTVVYRPEEIKIAAEQNMELRGW